MKFKKYFWLFFLIILISSSISFFILELSHYLSPEDTMNIIHRSDKK